MTLSIRRGELPRDRSAIIKFLHEYLSPRCDSTRFDWLYSENPYGAARIVVAENGSSGEMIGVAAAFPRTFSFQGSCHPGFVLGDFCLNPRYRSLGPAVQLQRACFEDANSGSGSVLYDFPSEGMLAVYRRLGLNSQHSMIRFAKPLGVRRKVAETVKFDSIARGISAVGDNLLAWRDRRLDSQFSSDIAFHEGPCGEEFSRLASRNPFKSALGVSRSASYLNWRFLRHPFLRYEILTACQRDELVGYLVFTQNGEDACIADLIWMDDTETLRALVSRVVQLLRTRGVMTVSLSMVASPTLARLFESMGFHKRDSCPALLWPPARDHDQTVIEENQWFLMDGDRES